MKRLLLQWRAWLTRRRRPADLPPLVLTQRRIYVLPTRAGLAYAMMLLLLLVASINYNLSLGYALTFLLGGLGIVSIMHAFRNLADLHIAPAGTTPGFAGKCVQFETRLASDRPRPCLHLQFEGGDDALIHLDQTRTVPLSIPATRRGWHAMPRLTIASTWPLGLVRAWSHVRFEVHSLAYPAPAAASPPQLGEAGTGSRLQGDPEDFFGLRPHRPTDLPQHVAWKASARLAGELLSKQFAAEHGAVLWLDLARIPGLAAQATLDEKISVLTRRALDAHAASRSFGLRLGAQEIRPASGDAHLHACLYALALHE